MTKVVAQLLSVLKASTPASQPLSTLHSLGHWLFCLLPHIPGEKAQVIKLGLKAFEATNIVTQSGGPAARHSEAKKVAKLLEKKFALFSMLTT